MARVEYITKWQQGISPERDTEEQPLIAQLYTACSELFSDLLATLRGQPSIERPTIVSLERSYGYLILWADGYGVKDGQLDKSIERSRRARQSTFRLLLSICQTLTSRLLPFVAEEKQAGLSSKSTEITQAIDKVKYLIHNDDAYDSDSDASSNYSSTSDVTELDEIAEDLKTDAQCLLDLGSRFMEQAVGPVADEKTLDPSEVATWDPSNNFIDRIRRRYPTCDEQLAIRLGKANWARVQRYQEMKDENTRPNMAGQPLKDDDVSIVLKPVPSRMASTSYHDSGIGTSIPSLISAPAASQYAETILSYHGGQGDSVRIPTLPDEAKKGDPFTCVTCGRVVRIKNKSAWKKHLFLDLQPYICLDDNCDFNGFPFATRAEWVDHLALEHTQSESRESIKCPICKETTGVGNVHITTHLARHLEEIALTILPTNPDSEDGTDSDSGLASSETSSRAEASTSDEKLHSRGLDAKPSDPQNAYEAIVSLVLKPLLRDDSLKDFHSSVEDLLRRLDGEMVLRDVELDLIHGAYDRAEYLLAPGLPREPRIPIPNQYQASCLALLQHIRSCLGGIHEKYQTHPHQPSYTEQYFLEMENKIRQRREDLKTIWSIWSVDENHDYFGNVRHSSTEVNIGRHTGMPALTEDKTAIGSEVIGGKQETIDNHHCQATGCELRFTIVDDLLQHEKQHGRLWKCPMPTCKYHEHGWPTEKELDRHINDKHAPEPATYECLIKRCPYTFTTESICKQHMENAHGWTHVRTESNVMHGTPDTRPATETISSSDPPQMLPQTRWPLEVDRASLQSTSPNSLGAGVESSSTGDTSYYPSFQFTYKSSKVIVLDDANAYSEKSADALVQPGEDNRSNAPSTIDPSTINLSTINPSTINLSTINPSTINPKQLFLSSSTWSVDPTTETATAGLPKTRPTTGPHSQNSSTTYDGTEFPNISPSKLELNPQVQYAPASFTPPPIPSPRHGGGSGRSKQA